MSKKYDDDLLIKLIEEGKPTRKQKFILKNKIHIEGNIQYCVFMESKGYSLGNGVKNCIMDTKIKYITTCHDFILKH